MSVNKVILIGRVGNEPEVKTLDNGTQVANFSLATSEKYKKDGKKVENTEWHKITIFGNLVSVVEMFVEKGKLLYLEGKNQTRSYEKDGQTFYTTSVICNQMTMLGGNNQEDKPSEPVQASEMPTGFEKANQSDELPF